MRRAQVRAQKRGVVRGGGGVLALRPIANRTKQPFINTHGSDGVNTHGKYISRHKINPGGVNGGFRLVFANRCRDGAAFNDITVKARVRYPSGTGTWQNVTFSSASSIVIPSGGDDAVCDPLNIVGPAGAYFDVESYPSVASVGQKWPTIDAVSLSAANGEGQLLGTSSLDGQTPSPGNVTEFYGPIAILGNSTATRAIAVIGDSIANGASDTLTGDRIGFIERVFGDHYPILNLASSGERIDEFVTSHTKRIAQLEASGVTDIVLAFGTNDVAAGDSYNLLRHEFLKLLAYLATIKTSITVLPVLVKCAGDVNTPATNYTVGGNADQLSALINHADLGLVSKVWDHRPAWQNGSNQILSATYTDDLLHPNAAGNAAIAAAAPAASTLLASAIPSEPVASPYVANNWKVFLADSLNTLADGAEVASWSSRDGSLTATGASGERPVLLKNATPSGKSAVKFSSAGAGLQKLVIPATAAINNIMDTGAWGAIYTVTRYATAGGNGTGRVWTKGAGETEALTTATNLRTTVDFNTTDIALNGTTAANTWYIRQFYKNTSNTGSLLQNTMNTATASGTGSTTHVDNSASNFIIGNHDSLARGWDGDIALIAIMKGATSTADQLWAAQAYFRALAGVPLI